MSFDNLQLPGGNLISGRIHGPRLHMDVYGGGDKFHVPYEGQTTLDMFTKDRPLSETLKSINTYNLGTFRADKAW